MANSMKVEVKNPGWKLIKNSLKRNVYNFFGCPNKVEQLNARRKNLLQLISSSDISKSSESDYGGPFFKMIDDPRLSFNVAKSVVPGSLLNGRNVAAEINRRTSSKLRIPTENELLKLNELLGAQLEGTKYWIWTEIEHERFPGQFVLRRLDFDYRRYFLPDYHYGFSAVRFVEDK